VLVFATPTELQRLRTKRRRTRSFEGMISRKNRQLVWFLIRVAAETSPSIKADSFKITVRIYDPIDPRGKLGRISIPILANRANSPGGLQPMEEAIGVLGLRDPSRSPWS